MVTMPNSLKLFGRGEGGGEHIRCMCSYALSSTAYVIDPRLMSQDFFYQRSPCLILSTPNRLKVGEEGGGGGVVGTMQQNLLKRWHVPP